MHVILLTQFTLHITAYLVIIFSDDKRQSAIGRHFLDGEIRRYLFSLGHYYEWFWLCCRLCLSLEYHLLGLQVGIAKRDGNHKLTTLFQVMGADSAVMELYE